MKKLDNIVGIALVSWGMMLLFIVMWLGNKYPEIQQDLLLIVRVYIGLLPAFVISGTIFRTMRRRKVNIHKKMKALKRNAILLLLYDLLVLCIAFVKNGMTNMSAEAVTSLIVSIGFGIFINLLWIVDSKTWITDYGKRKCIWSYWCGEIVLLLLVVALENMNQLVATSAILGMMAVYLIIGIWWVSRKL